MLAHLLRTLSNTWERQIDPELMEGGPLLGNVVSVEPPNFSSTPYHWLFSQSAGEVPKDLNRG